MVQFTIESSGIMHEYQIGNGFWTHMKSYNITRQITPILIARITSPHANTERIQ